MHEESVATFFVVGWTIKHFVPANLIVANGNQSKKVDGLIRENTMGTLSQSRHVHGFGRALHALHPQFPVSIAPYTLHAAALHEHAGVALGAVCTRRDVRCPLHPTHQHGRPTPSRRAVPKLTSLVGPPAVHPRVLPDRTNVHRPDRELTCRRQPLDANRQHGEAVVRVAGDGDETAVRNKLLLIRGTKLSVEVAPPTVHFSSSRARAARRQPRFDLHDVGQSLDAGSRKVVVEGECSTAQLSNCVATQTVDRRVGHERAEVFDSDGDLRSALDSFDVVRVRRAPAADLISALIGSRDWAEARLRAWRVGAADFAPTTNLLAKERTGRLQPEPAIAWDASLREARRMVLSKHLQLDHVSISGLGSRLAGQPVIRATEPRHSPTSPELSRTATSRMKSSSQTVLSLPDVR